MHYKSFEDLEQVKALIKEVEIGIGDKNRTLLNSSMADALQATKNTNIGAGVATAATAGAIAGVGAVGTATTGVTSGLAAAGAVAGGITAAGAAAIATPIVIAAGAYYYVTKNNKDKKLQEEKLRLYQKVLKQLHAVVKQLKEENERNRTRLEYYNALNIKLMDVIEKLSEDLGYAT